jgi:hypothetical protein
MSGFRQEHRPAGRRCFLRVVVRHGLTQPRPLLSRSFGRAGASEVMVSHAQAAAAQRHAAQEAGGWSDISERRHKLIGINLVLLRHKF